MKVKEIVFEAERLREKANNYWNTYYCTYMGEWAGGGTQEEYLKLRENIFNYLESEVQF